MGQKVPKAIKRELARDRAAQEEYERIRRRLPGVDVLISFFRFAGVHAELQRDGRLQINGRQTRPLGQILPPAGAFDWSEVIDEMAIRYASDRFIQAVAEYGRFSKGLRAFLRRGDMGFAIMRLDIRLGLIRATHAYVPGHDAVVANFLAPGSHWRTLADLIRQAEPALVAEHDRQRAGADARHPAGVSARPGPISAYRCIRRLPDSVPDDLRAACIEASMRLRLERQVAYDRPVVLVYGIGELTLLPVFENDGHFFLPFRIVLETGNITGRLVIADSDPLPLEIGEDVSSEDVVLGWTNALIGFADVTCFQLDQPTTHTVHPQTAGARISMPAPRQTPRPMRSGNPWPAHLIPIGPWARHSGSLVAGHRRRLTVGRTASESAHQSARKVGITLRQDETWVRPHARGIPDGVEMRFRWHRLDELNLQIPRTDGFRAD